MDFGAELGGDGFEARGDFVERFIPGDALEAAFAFGAACGAGDRAGGRASIRAPDSAPLCRTGIRA